FAGRLRQRFLSKARVRHVMRYWPNRKSFTHVRALHTLGDMEKFRRKLDYTQAVRDLEHQGIKPTAEKIRPLLHKNMMTHINDTPEQLPANVVKHPTPKQMHAISMASVYDQLAGKTPPLVVLDLRKPQDGLARRTVQKRPPQKQHPQKKII